MNSPRFYVDKNLSLRGIYHVGIIRADYSTIKKVFGQPVIAEENGDIIDDLSSATWPIQFENGTRAELSDNKKLGNPMHDGKSNNDFRSCTEWKVRGTNEAVFKYVEELLRNALV
jgi:hypothetical protein